MDDANASAMGGVAGHAGLFSTAGDVAVFAQMMLNGGIYAHHRLLARETVEQFTARVAIGDSARALGWDVPVEPSSTGKYFSARSYGHNGFTGTSLWIDPEKDLFVDSAHESCLSLGGKYQDSRNSSRACTMPSSRDSGSFPAAPPGDNCQVTNSTSRARFYAGRADSNAIIPMVKSRAAKLPETERRNPRSAGLDRKIDDSGLEDSQS